MGEGIREQTQTADNLRKAGITTSEILDTEEIRKALNAKWDNYKESVISRNQPMLKQTSTLLEALLQRELGGDTYQYMVGAPTTKFVPEWKLLGWEMLTIFVFGKSWKPGMDISFGVHVEADGQLMWGGTKQHYLMFIRKDVWQRRQAAIEAENEKNFNRHLPKGDMAVTSDGKVIKADHAMQPGEEGTSTEIGRETVRAPSKTFVGRRGPGRPKKG